MKRKWTLAQKVGLLVASSSLFLAACQQGTNLKLDTKAVNDASAAKKTANGKDVQLYDTGR
ncbi:hypothetical protein ACMZ6Y_13060, partial [Streptococcus pluranimalium]